MDSLQQDFIIFDDQDNSKVVEFTLIDSADPLTKRYVVSADGSPQKAADPFLATGGATRFRVSVDDFSVDFVQVLGALNEKQCLVLGALSDKIAGEYANITTKRRHAPSEPGDGSPLIWRGKDWLGYRKGVPAVLGIDHDAKDLPSELRARLEAAGGLIEVLSAACPALRNVGYVARPSVSTGITVNGTGNRSAGGGLHIYIPIVDGEDAQDFIARLHNHLVLAGWGFPFVSDAGSISIRSLIDTAASGVGERLWFEAPAILGEGLAYEPGARDPYGRHGSLLDTRVAIASPSDQQAVSLRQIEQNLRASVLELANEKRHLRIERIGTEMNGLGQGTAGVDARVAQLRDADERGVLNGRHVLHIDDGRLVSVSDVLKDRGAYHRATCADPLEPEYGGGTNKGILYTDGRHVRLFSHAHGGRLFTLAYDEEDVIAAVASAKEDGGQRGEIIARLTPDLVFSSGGWEQIKRATQINAADALGFGQQSASSDAGQPAPITATEPETSDAATNTAPLDPNPAIDLLMREFNKNLAVVGEGGSVSIVRLAYNAELDRRMPVSMTTDAFKLLYGNRYVSVLRKGRDGEEEYQDKPATGIWLAHKKRRTCHDGFGLDPTGKLPDTCFNLWQGFGVEEKQGDWSKLANMIHDVLASGNYDHFVYIVNWLAHLVQRPHENPGVALVFRGEEGVGKGTFGKAIMRLMRPHAMQITQAKHLTGAFNAHMRTVLFLFADEAFFAGDRANEGTLKGLITEEFRMNEGKGRDATLGRNRIHLMMSSNNDWVVPASAEARRYAVLDVSSVHKQDPAYFGPINDEMDIDGEAAGIAAMLYDLRRYPLDMSLVRKAPETAGLHAQRIASLRGPWRWLFDVLTRGYVGPSSGETWEDHYTTEDLLGSYHSWSKDMKEAFPADGYAVGKVLKSMFQPYRPRISGRAGTTERPPSYRLGTLAQARAVFSKEQGFGDPWRDENDGGNTAAD
jgi:Family of unknown function (DUF5906)